MSSSVQMMNSDEARQFVNDNKPDSFTLLDVRQDWEYEEFHLPGARHIPLPELPDRMGEIESDKPVLVYCAVGGRSMAAASLLQGQDYPKVINLVDGAMGWNGDVAFGPMELGMIEFDGKETPVEMVLKAYAMEHALQKFYLDEKAKAQSPDRIELFDELAGFEDKHKDTLYTLYKRLVEGGAPREPFEEQALKTIGEAAEGGVVIQEFIDEYAEAFDTEEGVLQVAAMIEAQALDYYLRCAARAQDNKTRDILQLLAREERAHLKLLGRFMDKRSKG